MDNYSTFLFARPSIAEGVGRLVDISGSLTEFNQSTTGEQADKIALKADWKAVGAAFRAAIETVKKERPDLQNNG